MNKKEFLEKEIETLKVRFEQIKNEQIFWIIGAFVGLIFPLVSICCLFMIVCNTVRLNNINKEIKMKRREVRLIRINGVENNAKIDSKAKRVDNTMG